MPRPPRPSVKKLSCSDLSKRDVQYMLANNIISYQLRDARVFAKTWKQWRKAILKSWVDVLPGSRPHGWWMFDATERRRTIEGVDFFERRPDIDIAARKYRFGMSCGTDFKLPEPVYEKEADYLSRLGLLTDEEKQIPLELLRENSCDSYKRVDQDNMDKILRLLGF